MPYNAVVRRSGFRPLGDITVNARGKPVFPSPPPGAGLYFIEFNTGGGYVGETGRFSKDAKGVGRFDHYRSPADDIWTELVIHRMLLVGGGGRVFVLVANVDKRERLRMEAAQIAACVQAGVKLWNSGAGRDERVYLSWLLPIMEHMLTLAEQRYADRTALKPYARARLPKLRKALSSARAAGRALGLSLPTGKTPVISGSQNLCVSVPNDCQATIVRAAPPPISLARDAPSRTRQVPSKEVLRKRRGAGGETAMSIVHRYLAAHPEATFEELRLGVSDAIKSITTRTLWSDYRMTRKAMEPGRYVAGEPDTLTIRRIVCRLWTAHPDNVTSHMVEEELRAQGHERKPGTISAITGNGVSTLKAFAAAQRPARSPR